MSPDFQKQHGDLVSEIVLAALEVLPSHWDEAIVELSCDTIRLGHAVAISIRHPQGLPDRLMPTDELYEAANKLERICHLHQQSWAQASIHLTRSGDEWDFKANFGYRDSTLS
jgi:hypothetical protein